MQIRVVICLINPPYWWAESVCVRLETVRASCAACAKTNVKKRGISNKFHTMIKYMRITDRGNDIYKLIHSCHNRQICSLKGFRVSVHRLSCPVRSPLPPSPLPFVQTQAPKPFQTPSSPCRLCDLQDTLDKLTHFLPQLSDFVTLQNGFYSFRAQTDYHHPVDPGTIYTVVPRGVADLYP